MAVVADASRRRRRSARRLGAAAAVLMLLTVAAAAGAFFLSTLFFIGVDDGRLAPQRRADRARPDPAHAVYRRSVVTYDSLSPSAWTLVDEQRLRDRSNAFSVSDQLGMWP